MSEVNALLEERQEDIPLLADHFLIQFAKQQSKKTERFHGEIIRFIMHHEWPGNIRELENFVERMVTLTPQNSRQIDIDMMPKEFLAELNQLKKHQHDLRINKSLHEMLKDYEKELIRQALIQHHWNQSSTASTLGIPESTLRYKMQKYKIKK